VVNQKNNAKNKNKQRNWDQQLHHASTFTKATFEDLGKKQPETFTIYKKKGKRNTNDPSSLRIKPNYTTTQQQPHITSSNQQQPNLSAQKQTMCIPSCSTTQHTNAVHNFGQGNVIRIFLRVIQKEGFHNFITVDNKTKPIGFYKLLNHSNTYKDTKSAKKFRKIRPPLKVLLEQKKTEKEKKVVFQVMRPNHSLISA
jgi:hypothetical protein